MSKPIYTPAQVVNLMTESGRYWAGGAVTFGFPENDGLDAVQKQFVTEAIALWDDVTNLDISSNGDSGEITFDSDMGGGDQTSSRYYSDGRMISASVTFDRALPTNQSENLAYGSYGFESMLYEIGHALGLSHPGDYNGSADYDDDAIFQQDTVRYTVMSYFNADEDGSGTSWWYYSGSVGWEWHYAETPMIYDILAVESLYGRETDTRTGDTTYGYHSTADSDVFDFHENPIPILTIFDCGGTDTLDLSGDTVDHYFDGLDDYQRVIDLNEGAFSSTHGMTNNIGIAFGTIIENAVGTKFDDHIIGNGYSNKLQGCNGADQIDGGDASDVILGGRGPDSSSGDAGNDALFVYLGANTLSFNDKDGIDLVFGYKPGVDQFDLIHVDGPNSFEDLTLTNVGIGTLVDYGDGSFILMNTSLRSVDEGDFLL